MKKHLKVVEDNRASKGIRFANFIIDRIVIYIIFFLFGALALLVSEIFNIEVFQDILNKMASANRLEDILITTAVYLLYIFLMEYFTRGRTIGKYITGTKVMSLDGSNPTFQEYLIRTVSRIVPFDGLSFFGENGWHDSWSDTRVININKYNQQMFVKSDIDSIGIKENA